MLAIRHIYYIRTMDKYKVFAYPSIGNNVTKSSDDETQQNLNHGIERKQCLAHMCLSLSELYGGRKSKRPEGREKEITTITWHMVLYRYVGREPDSMNTRTIIYSSNARFAVFYFFIIIRVFMFVVACCGLQLSHARAPCALVEF